MSGCGEIKLKYNNYNQSFTITDGVLKWEDVDDAYAISFVFQGEFVRRVVGNDGRVVIQCEEGYQGLVSGEQYTLEVLEDEDAGVGNPEISREYVPPSNLTKDQCPCHTKGAARSAELREELKKINPDDLRAQTDKYKELKEARDLEDVLYG